VAFHLFMGYVRASHVNDRGFLDPEDLRDRQLRRRFGRGLRQ